jgi:hypothetical protein
MAPVVSSLASELKSWVAIDDAFTTDGKVVIFQVCCKKIGCTMKSQLEQHIRSAFHTKHKQLQCSKKQVLLTQMQQESGIRNEFFKDLCHAVVAADTPWYKFQVPKFLSFFEKYCKKQVPDESTLRKNYLHACYQETIVNIREEIGESYIWVAVDETTDVLGRFVANLILGKLDPEALSKSFFILSKVPEHTDHSTVARFVNDGLKVLWPESVQEE